MPYYKGRWHRYSEAEAGLETAREVYHKRLKEME